MQGRERVKKDMRARKYLDRGAPLDTLLAAAAGQIRIGRGDRGPFMQETGKTDRWLRAGLPALAVAGAMIAYAIILMFMVGADITGTGELLNALRVGR
jgi:hypothetical protein